MQDTQCFLPSAMEKSVVCELSDTVSVILFEEMLMVEKSLDILLESIFAKFALWRYICSSMLLYIQDLYLTTF